MATLVSPGVSVTVTDESFFIPAAAPTVPLFFIATAEEKKQQDGVTDAAGTFESGVVRTITSLAQSLELYGVPRFLEDSSGNQYHGDARNEYGLFALNQFLAQGTRAYVVRANVNLNDDIEEVRDLWDQKIQEASFELENLVNILINDTNLLNQKFPGDTFQNAYYNWGNYNGSLSNESELTGLSGGETITIVVDGTTYSGLTAPAPSGSPSLTYAQLFASLESQMSSAASFSISGGNVRLTSNATQTGSSTPLGAGSSVAVSSDTIFTATTQYVVSVGSPIGSPFSDLDEAVAGVDGYKETVTRSEYQSLVNQAMEDVVYPLYSFQNVESDFEDDQSLAPFSVFPNGFDQPAVSPAYHGIAGRSGTGAGGLNAAGTAVGPADDGTGTTSGVGGSNPSFPAEWTAQDAADDLTAAADDFKYTQEFFNATSLGANDAARRTAIVTALQAEINSNVDIRSENFEYNLVLCPGYWETVDEMTSLVTGVDVKEEAFVIADTPSTMDPSETVAWAQTISRVTSQHVAYYYPWQLASNIDGTDVVVAPSGTALRTYAFSDEVAELWFAPAGTRRGLVTGVSDLGYVSGTLGQPTELIQTYVNQGQRDDLYRYFVNINPIVFFPGRGILIWGQKTVAANASALDRVNVSRLVKYIKRQLRKNTLSFVFEPNDQLTRDNLKAVVDAFLSDLVVKRGLYDYASVSDESNNTPARIDRNEMFIDIALKPVKSAEFLYIPIRIVSTGASLTAV